MRPEVGDSGVQVSLGDVSASAKSVGSAEGDTVMLHSSLSSMGTVVGGTHAVIDGLLDAVGSTGTLAIPTLCNWTPEKQHLSPEIWKPRTSPSYVGLIGEPFRLRREAIRSGNRRATWLVDAHLVGQQPCPPCPCTYPPTGPAPYELLWTGSQPLSTPVPMETQVPAPG